MYQSRLERLDSSVVKKHWPPFQKTQVQFLTHIMQPPLSLFLVPKISFWSPKTKYACGPDIYAGKVPIHIKINI